MISKAIKEAKQGDTEEEQNLLCHALQSLEATIVYDEIAPKLQEMGIGCPFIHDSALAPESRVREAEQVFDEVLKGYGLPNAYKTEDSLQEAETYAFKKSKPSKATIAWHKGRRAA